MEKLRPPDVDEGAACSGAVVSFSVMKKKITLGSFRGICHQIIQSIEGMVIATFERTKEAAVTKAQKEVDRGRGEGRLALPKVLSLGEESIRDTYQNYRRAAGATFVVLIIVSAISYMTLVAGLIGGFNLVLGRLLFDPRLIRSSSASAMTFRLDPAKGNAKALDYDIYDELKLAESGSATWFVSFQAMRVGNGTHMRLCAPQPLTLFFQRLPRVCS